MGTMAPHVVVIPLPVHGHFNPLLQLSVQLASRGVTVSFVTTDSTKPRVLAALRSILALSGKEEEEEEDEDGCRSNLRLLSLSDGDYCREKLEGGGDPGIWQNIIFMSSKAEEIEQMLESSAWELGPISCMIIDFLVLFRVKELATKRGIPVALFWTSSTAYLLLTMDLKTLVERGYAPLKIESSEDSIDSSLIPGIPRLRLCDDLPFTLQSGIEEDPGFQNTCKLRQHFLDAHWVLVNTFQELDDDALCAVQKEGVKIVTVGPLLPVELWKSTSVRLDGASDEILEWLSRQARSSVVYVSFGTQADLPREQLEELAYGLEASGQPFLWVLRPGHATKLPESFLEGFKLRTQDRGLVVSWCAQLHVLRHPSVGGFLTHGGWNSILESICCGVPMIGWPCMAEQNLNCKYMADVWEIGKRILTPWSPDGNGKRVDRGEIERAITGLIASEEGKESRKRAAQLREAARRAVEVGGSSHGNIDDLVQAFKNSTIVSQEGC